MMKGPKAAHGTSKKEWRGGLIVGYIQHNVLFLSEEDITATLTPEDVILVSEQVFYMAGEARILPGDNAFLPADTSRRNKFIAMPVTLPDLGVSGMKWISTFRAPQLGFPFSHGNLILLNKSDTAAPLLIAAATGITTMRTAGGHAVVAAKYLSVPRPEVMTVVGCGAQGRSGVRGFLSQFPSLKEIRLCSRSNSSCRSIQEEFKERCTFRICTNPREAVRGSQIVLMASSSHEVLVKADWLEPGTTVLALAAFNDMDPEATEAADRWILGYEQADKKTIFADPAAKSHGRVLNPEKVDCDMTRIITGKAMGRQNEKEVILYSHLGMGAFDIACAHMAYQRAVEKGIGQWLVL